jgi:hypothetical protein
VAGGSIKEEEDYSSSQNYLQFQTRLKHYIIGYGFDCSGCSYSLKNEKLKNSFLP